MQPAPPTGGVFIEHIMDTIIRPADIIDLPAILEIVNYNIENTTAVYDYDAKSLADIEFWLQQKQQHGWPVIVAVAAGIVAGYATYGTFRFKEGYKHTIEHSVYVSHGYLGRGIGGLLLAELIQLAKDQGYHTMIGGIDAGNKSSIAFHEKFGFTSSGVLKEVGYKFGQWLDVQFMQLMLK